MTGLTKIDFHMHSTVSDGTDAPSEILARVKESGIAWFSLTDHDAIRGCEEIIPLLGEEDAPVFVTGAEFSCRDGEGKYHILGYGYDPQAQPIRELVDHGHALRMNKVRARLDFIAERFGFAFSDEDLDTLLAQPNPGKPHIANLMVRYGYAETKEEAIRSYINQKKFHSEYIEPGEAIRHILDAGGIPVLAHPAYGSGDQVIVGEELRTRVDRLMTLGLRGVEAFYSGFTEKLRNELLSIAAQRDLYVTAGSDYHGTNKLVILGDTGLEADMEMPEGLQRFLRDVRHAT